jgi:hypothetical protein
MDNLGIALLRLLRDMAEMFIPHEASECPTGSVRSSNPVITTSEAHVARAEREQRYARGCLLLAAVTSPQVSAELINRAAECTRTANSLLRG